MHTCIQATTALAETTAIADFRGLTVFPLYTSFTVYTYLKAKDMKYTIGSEDDDYKTKLFLNITLTESADFGAYYCISKNEKGLTKGAVELYGKQTRSI